MEMEIQPNLRNLVDNTQLRWIFVGGKGGVGKTTTSSSLAVLLSEHRKNVLIVSTDPAHNLSDAFDQQFSKEPTLVKGFSNLWALEVDPKVDPKSFKFSVPDALKVEEVDQATQSFIGEFISSVPGIDEAMSFGELVKTIDTEKYDVVVFDTAPTGHTLRLLNFPELLDRGLQKLIDMKARLGAVLGQFSALLGGEETINSMYDSLFGNVESMKESAEKVNRQMKDSARTEFVAVLIPEFLSLYETERLIQELSKYQIAIKNLVVNQIVFPEGDCRKCKARYRMQKKYLDQIYELYEDFHITIMAQQDEEVRGIESLKGYGKLLLQSKSLPKIE
eukprot:TRINITY_DN24695_c0_g1_i1.p1 TRINITY_DN24695_c0_g1~~TRINITY_DN24695_c0_g1_i1.p1  ORF type:complete len:334 (-),score=104.49 TRINITY_DN24695_c0_g1_i1:34-1035(-)